MLSYIFFREECNTIEIFGIVLGFAILVLFIEYVVGRKSEGGKTMSIDSMESDVDGFGGARGYDHFVAFQPPIATKAFPFGLRLKRVEQKDPEL